MLAKVRRPSTTPSATTSRSDASRMISAAAWATPPVAPSTDSPISAAFSAGEIHETIIARTEAMEKRMDTMLQAIREHAARSMR
jgi:hypothetical protein